MTTLHRLIWDKKDLGIYVNFESKHKQLIETLEYEGNYYNILKYYPKELNIKFIPYDLAYTRRLKQLADFWAYMPIDIDKDRAGKRTKFFNYLTAKPLFGYDTDHYTPKHLAYELAIKLWLAYYYHKRLNLLYELEPAMFDHISSKVKRSPKKYRTLLRVTYSPSTKFVRIELTEYADANNKHSIVLPYDVYLPTGITGSGYSENIELLFRVIFNLPKKKETL
jgi:hypothetical protein